MSTKRKIRSGIVVSNKMDKTIVVKVTDLMRHPLYGKTIKRSKKFYAHDEKNVAGIGDRVQIYEVRPLSKLKRWTLEKIIEKATE